MDEDASLIARSDEQAAIVRLLNGIDSTDGIEGGDGAGGTLVLCGPAGIGKSALLDWAADARPGPSRLLRARGTTAELGLAYGGLHQLLRPLQAHATALTPGRRDALAVVFGQAPEHPPDLYAVAMAALDLLTEAAQGQPLLVLVDDVQWMDPASQQVLAFVGRRTASDRVVLLVTQRDSEPGPMLDRTFPILDLTPLDRQAAAAVLDRTLEVPDAQTRTVILDIAEGNPLALRELPWAFQGSPPRDLARLPLTGRLVRSFTSRLDDLDPATRTALGIAAADDAEDLAEILAASELILGQAPAHILEPAVFAGLIYLERHVVRFSHPLVRSSIYQRLAPQDRRAAHAALADATRTEHGRSLRHRAAAAVYPDGVLASELERSADQALALGAPADAASALDRSAALSVESVERRRRLFRAACLAYQVGSSDYGDHLRARYRDLVHGEADRLRSEWLSELARTDDGGEHRIDVLLSAAERARATGEQTLALRFLRLAAIRCWNFQPDRTVGRSVVAVADALGIPDPAARAALLAHGAPLGSADTVLALISAARASGPDPTTVYQLGHAAACVGAFDVSVDLFAAAAVGLRAEGKLHTLGTTLALLSWSALRRGRLEVAITAADEAARLCAETHQPFWTASALAAHGIVAALRGDIEQSDELIDHAARVAAPHHFLAVNAVVLVARAISASSTADYDRAFTFLARLHDPIDSAHHPMHGLWSLANFADAALGCGQENSARKVLADLRPEVQETSSPTGRMNLTYAATVLAPDDEAERRFRDALSWIGATWPHEHNRLRLGFGMWLRRHRRVQESRNYLRAARDGFDDLGSLPWAARAREELQATGEQSREPIQAPITALSPQEAQIAALVADGLSNREIGERLFLSHRTVGSHLYRMFPKLGIRSRTELVRLIDDRRAPGP